MSSQVRMILSAVAILLFSIPAMARADKAPTDTAQWDTEQETKIGNIDLKPGDYEFRWEESGSQMQILQDGKIIGEVPVHSIALPKKSPDTEVLTDQDKVIKVQFKGRTEAVQIQ